MQSKKYKDIKLRLAFLKNEKIQKVYKFLFINLLSNPKNEKNFSLIKSTFVRTKFFSKNHSKTKIKSRCVLTNRSKAIFKNFSFSRIIMREFINLGIIPGYKKAVW